MNDLLVKRWVRYGHDRWYVQTADGLRLGYLDNKTGAAVLDDEAHRNAFDAALAARRAHEVSAATATSSTVPAQPAAADVKAALLSAAPLGSASDAGVLTDKPRVNDRGFTRDQQTRGAGPIAPRGDALEWSDLAATRAGAAAREQALALRRAAPVRTFLARALGVKTDERAWRIGADGEEAVATRLAKLGDRWRVLHAVPVGDNGSDIDHLVIGPAGVFTVNSKHHPDAAVWVGGNTVMVNGHRVPYVRNSRFEARRAAKLLSAALHGMPLTATGLIAVMGARNGFTVKAQPPDGDVVITTRREVARWLARQPVTLTDERIEAIFAVARRSDTWHRYPRQDERLSARNAAG